MLYLSFELVKLNFTTVAPLEKSFWPPHGKIQYCPPLWKNIFDAHGPRTTYWTTCINQSQCRVLLQCKNRDIIKLQISLIGQPALISRSVVFFCNVRIAISLSFRYRDISQYLQIRILVLGEIISIEKSTDE